MMRQGRVVGTLTLMMGENWAVTTMGAVTLEKSLSHPVKVHPLLVGADGAVALPPSATVSVLRVSPFQFLKVTAWSLV